MFRRHFGTTSYFDFDFSFFPTFLEFCLVADIDSAFVFTFLF